MSLKINELIKNANFTCCGLCGAGRAGLPACLTLARVHKDPMPKFFLPLDILLF